MRSAGRYDPCPCGSGLSYKDCCLRRAPAGPAPPFAGATREGALSKLLAFAYQPVFDADHSVAESVFWGDLLRSAGPDVVQRLLDADDTNVKYNFWFLFDWQVDNTGSVADLFLEERPAGLSDAEWQLLDALTHIPLRLYEIELADRGRGLRLVDLWTGDRIVVAERPVMSDQVATWDVLGARVAPDGSGGHRFEGGLYVYPAHAKQQLLTRFRQAYRRYQRRSRGGDDAAFFRKHGALFHHLWLDIVGFPDPPQVTTTEGDPLMFCRAVFETERLEEVRQAIGGHPDVRLGGAGRFVLEEPTRNGATELGRWSFEGQRVFFETTSRARAARGRRWLEALAGGLVQYRATALEPVEQTMEMLRRGQGRQSAEAAPGVNVRAVKELFDRHYRSWIDRPEPTLGNRTPRAAARTKLWRPRLIELLKRMENDAGRAVLAGRPSYDFHWIWTELGLERGARRSARGSSRS